MNGYRQSSFDPDAEPPTKTAQKGNWWKIILWSAGYMIPLIWMWSRTDYPDSFGVHITAHGRAGLAESWYYSYLLLKRHHVLDVITFVYMWSIVIGLIAWIASKQLQKTKLPFYLGLERSSTQNAKIIGPLANRVPLPRFSASEWVLILGLFIVVLLGSGWAFDFHPKTLGGIFTSEQTVRSRCFNWEGSYPQREVTEACKRLLEDSSLAIRGQPSDADAYFDRGFAYEHTGDLNRAVADFSQVVRLTPDRTDAYYYRWAAYKDLGKDTLADADFATLSRLDPKYAANIRSIR